MPPLSSNQIIDRVALQARLARALGGAESAPANHPLLERVEEDVCDRLISVLRRFEKTVVLSPWPSALATQISALDSTTEVSELRVLGSGDQTSVDDELLPFAPESLDLMLSTFALQATNDLPGALIQARRALRPDGLFLGVLFAGRTLNELRASLLEAESEITGGASPRVLPFADVRELGGLMQRAGFALPVADVDSVQITYETPVHLLKELQTFAATNVLMDRLRTMGRRDVLMRAMEIYGSKYTTGDGRIKATIDLVTLTGWAPSPDQQQPLRPGSATTRLSDALGTEEHKLPDAPRDET